MSRKRKILSLEIILALAAKAALLTILYYVCFSPAHQPKIDARMIDQHLFSSSTAIR